MAYTITAPEIAGILPIASTDAGFTTPGGTVIPTPPLTLGMEIRAFDPTYGEGEFILLPGVTSNFVGATVIYNATTYAPSLLTVSNGKNKGVPVAVSMAANTSSSVYSWYQIGGNAVMKKTTVAVTPQVPIFISATSGRIKVLASAGQQILGAQTANLTTIVTTTSTVVVTINRPHTQGQIT